MRLTASDWITLYVMAVLVVFGQSMAGDPGLGWHLRAGQWMTDNREVPTHDLFAFTTQGATWIHDQWFGDVLLWWVYSLGGFPLLHVGAIGLVVAAFVAVPGSMLERRGYAPYLIVLTLVLSASTGAIQWLLRPVLFSFMLFALLHRALLRFFDEQQPPLFLAPVPALFLLWANVHPAFVLGWMLLGVAVGVLIVRRDRRVLGVIGITLLSLIATLCTPHGIALHRKILTLGSSSGFMSLNREWLAPEWANAFFPFYLLAALLLLFAIARSGWRTMSGFEGCVVVLLLVAGFVSRRYIPFFAIAAPAPLLAMITHFVDERPARSGKVIGRLVNLITRRSKRGAPGMGMMIPFAMWLWLVVTTVWSQRVPFRSEEDSAIPPRFPKQAVELIAHAPAARVFHTPDWGGYLSWRLYPRESVFIDDRNVLHGEARYREYFDLERERRSWAEAVERYDFRWALLRPQAPLADTLRKSEQWTLVLEEKAVDPEGDALLFRRNDAAERAL
ncbi:MAG: hypothetical protein KDD69_06910 [Bdellovibrionales bacterium]|nr:hypothetical protein [Bdellovibrionales bacterium]